MREEVKKFVIKILSKTPILLSDGICLTNGMYDALSRRNILDEVIYEVNNILSSIGETKRTILYEWVTYDGRFVCKNKNNNLQICDINIINNNTENLTRCYRTDGIIPDLWNIPLNLCRYHGDILRQISGCLPFRGSFFIFEEFVRSKTTAETYDEVRSIQQYTLSTHQDTSEILKWYRINMEPKDLFKKYGIVIHDGNCLSKLEEIIKITENTEKLL